MAGRVLGRAAVAVVLLAIVAPVGPHVTPAGPDPGTPGSDRNPAVTDAPAAAYAAAGSDGARSRTSRSAGAAQEPRLHRSITLSLTPETPGEIGAHVVFDVPAGATRMLVWVPEGATVRGTEGFTRVNETHFEWDRVTDQPSLTYRQPANETDARRRARPAQAGAGYTFVDAGPWALVSTPVPGTRVEGFGQAPRFTREVSVDGQGVPGHSISYLGPYEEHARTAAGQRLRLVVPAAATLAEPPEEILSAVGDAAARLEFGHRDEEVLLFAAPTTVAWGAPGVQVGPNEFWVRDDERLDSAGTIWFHEYVHTRQEGTAAPSGRWLTEATAEYYATHLALRLGLVSFADHRGHLSIGTRPEYAAADLSDPSTWDGTGANYWKGALVAGAIDRRIRLATDGERTLGDAYGRVVDDRNLANGAFLDAVEAVAGADVRDDAARYTTGGAAPTLWNETEHAVAFGSAVDVRTSVSSVSVSGPYRNATVQPGAPLVPGETVAVALAVENVDATTGRFAVVLRVDGRPVAAESGVLAPGEETTVRFERRFETVGGYTLGAGDAELSVPVRAPAAASVRGLVVPDRAPPGEPFAVAVDVANDADRPAVDEVTVAADGEPVGAAQVALAPGERDRATVRVSIEDPGQYTITAGNVSGTIEITPDATPPGTPDTGSTDGPGGPGSTDGIGGGFGPVAALLALLVVGVRLVGR